MEGPRILGIDPGERRVGLAISDPLGITAQGLETFDRRTGELAGHIRAGRLKYRETISEGFETAPAAFRGLLAGRNFGKQLVKIA